MPFLHLFLHQFLTCLSARKTLIDYNSSIKGKESIQFFGINVLRRTRFFPLHFGSCETVIRIKKSNILSRDAIQRIIHPVFSIRINRIGKKGNRLGIPKNVTTFNCSQRPGFVHNFPQSIIEDFVIFLKFESRGRIKKIPHILPCMGCASLLVWHIPHDAQRQALMLGQRPLALPVPEARERAQEAVLAEIPDVADELILHRAPTGRTPATASAPRRRPPPTRQPSRARSPCPQYSANWQ